MPIAKGAEWGETGPLPAGGVVVPSDAAARQVVEAARRAGRPVPPLGLVGGDLCRTLGGTGDEDRIRSTAARRLPVDVGSVLLDGRIFWFVSHLVARRAWWRGQAWLAMNAQWIGPWNVAPRAHPNDGRLDVIDAAVPAGQRLAVRRRLLAGSHLPHPAIRERRVPAAQVELARPTPVWLDGEEVGEFRRISVRLEVDGATVVV